MSRNSKQKRDKKKKAQKKAMAFKEPKFRADPIAFKREIDKIFDPEKLTTPIELNDDIKKFCSEISNAEPIFIDVTPEPWSRQSCCDMNVKKYIEDHGGQIVCGYKVWYHDPIYIEGERHAVWFKDGEYKDISFNADGEKTVLFLPDVPEKQEELEQNRDKIRWCKTPKVKELIKIQEYNESMALTFRHSNEEAWAKMLTYEDWCKGQRMDTIQYST